MVPDRRGLRRGLQRSGRCVRFGLLPEREPLGARDRWLHARVRVRRQLADADGDHRRRRGYLSGAGSPAPDGRGRPRLRRPGHPVRHDDQPLESGQGLRPHQLEQSLLGVHVPRRYGLQPGQPEPDDASSTTRATSASRTSSGPRRSRSSRRRSSSITPTTPRRRSRRTAISSGRSVSATRTWARC